jgi:hypothetical protein
VLFALLGAFTSIVIYRRRSWRLIFGRDFLLFLALSLAPSLVYYGNGIFIAGYLRWKVDTSFIPALYLRREYWESWLLLAIDGAGF